MKITELFSRREKTQQMDPKHVGLIISLDDEKAYENISETSNKVIERINELIQIMPDDNIPILTLFFPQKRLFNEKEFLDVFVDYIEKIPDNEFINKNQVRVSFIGKWYDSLGDSVDSIKKCIDATQGFDKFFLNICINYDGQQEIIDSFRVIMKKLVDEGISPDDINKSSIKEHLYTSYFLPPDLIVATGKERKLKGFLLSDSVNSVIYFPNKEFFAFSKAVLRDYVLKYRATKN